MSSVCVRTRRGSESRLPSPRIHAVRFGVVALGADRERQFAARVEAVREPLERISKGEPWLPAQSAASGCVHIDTPDAVRQTPAKTRVDLWVARKVAFDQLREAGSDRAHLRLREGRGR